MFAIVGLTNCLTFFEGTQGVTLAKKLFIFEIFEETPGAT